jgi:hypothetical protein
MTHDAGVNVCAICQREPGVAPLHAGASEQLCGRCVGRLAQQLPRLDELFSPNVKPPVDALDPDAAEPRSKKGEVPEPRARPPFTAEDAETHFDLAIAYRELGLRHDALGEFAVTLELARGPFLARVLDALFGKGSGWKRDLRALRDALYPA